MLNKILISTALIASQVSAKFLLDDSDFTEANFTQTIDHFPPTPPSSNDQDTYPQRYFVTDKFFDKEKGPVFLYICGEGTCRPPSDRGFPY